MRIEPDATPRIHIPTDPGPISAEKLIVGDVTIRPHMTAGDLCAKHLGKRIRFTGAVSRVTVEDTLQAIETAAAPSEYISVFVLLGMKNVNAAEQGPGFRLASTTRVEVLN